MAKEPRATRPAKPKADDAPKGRVGKKPYEWKAEVEDEIMKGIADARSIRSVLSDEGLPSWETLRLRLEADPEFAARYTRAKRAAAEKIAEEILEIADDTSRDYIDTESGRAIDHEHVQRSRLRIDARKWYASKLDPKVYGDKQEVAHTGGITITVTPDDAEL